MILRELDRPVPRVGNGEDGVFGTRVPLLSVVVQQFEAEAREALRQRADGTVPGWWYVHNMGTIPDAILADSFEAFLERVADGRWHNYLGKNVTDERGEIIVRDIIKLEEPQRILAYFHQTLGLADFVLRWENPGARMPLEWPASLRRKLLDTCGEDYERFGYSHNQR